MKLFTIGFNKKSADEFFEPLKKYGVKILIDIRLKNTSHLAGFTKKNDLEYFLREIAGIKYHHELLLAPAEELLEKYKKDGDWEYYEKAYPSHLDSRNVKEKIDHSLFGENAVLLCAEETPDKCHRRLAADYLAEFLDIEEIVHL